MPAGPFTQTIAEIDHRLANESAAGRIEFYRALRAELESRMRLPRPGEPLAYALAYIDRQIALMGRNSRDDFYSLLIAESARRALALREGRHELAGGGEWPRGE